MAAAIRPWRVRLRTPAFLEIPQGDMPIIMICGNPFLLLAAVPKLQLLE
jgi:hypothetical protein